MGKRKFNLKRTAYVEGRVIVGLMGKSKCFNTANKVTLVNNRSRRKHGIFTKQKGGLEYEY